MTAGTGPSAPAPRPPTNRADRIVDALFRWETVLVFVFLYAPIILVVIFSFNAGERTGELRGLSLRWYERAIGDPFAMGALRNSLTVAAWTALIATVLGTGAALALARVNRYVRLVFDVFIYVAIIIPGLVLGIASLLFFVNLWAWANPVLAAVFDVVSLAPPVLGSGLHTIVAAHVLFTMAIVIVLVRARLAGMDRSLVEASGDLYATPLRTLRRVILPQLRPAILAGALLSFTFSFDDFIVAQFVAGPGQVTLPMYVFSSIRRGITPQINAIGSIVLAVTVTGLVIVSLVYWRQLRQTATRRRIQAALEADAEAEIALGRGP